MIYKNQSNKYISTQDSHQDEVESENQTQKEQQLPDYIKLHGSADNSMCYYSKKDVIEK